MNAQSNFRTLLDCAARPGTLGRLEDITLAPPAGLQPATACAALALLGPEVSFYIDGMDNAQVRFLHQATQALVAPEADADFLILNGSSPARLASAAKAGTLAYPETGATLFVQVAAFSVTPHASAPQIVFTGPGIEDQHTVFVSGLCQDLLSVVMDRNREFPLGLDTFLFAGNDVVAIPRTTRIDWSGQWAM